MALPDELQAIFDRIITGTQTSDDLGALRGKLILGGQENVKQSGKYNVNIGDGKSITIGDTVYQGPSAEAIRHAIQEALKTGTWVEAAKHWSVRPIPISELELEAFELGDRSAATFPYIIDPIRDAYIQTVQALEDASDATRRVKRGTLILGESNAGKTRLALEALKQTLPNWSLLRWRPYYTRDDIPPSHLLQAEQLVLFLDDLQEYAEASSSKELAGDQVILPEQSARTLLMLVEDVLLQARQNAIIVATCRSENLEQVQAVLDALLARLAFIEIPTYKDSLDSQQAKQVITAFRQQGSIHLEDWDGTMGSLVLGLSKKYDYYVTLPSHAKNVLKAMKLLTLALTTIHTEQRIRAICTEVFTDKALLEDELVWRETIDLLTNTQFIREDFDRNRQDFIYVIRKDSYFEKVVRDYPPSHRPAQKERHLIQLRKVFKELKDSGRLLNLVLFHFLASQFEDANVILDQAFALEPDNIEAWSLKSVILFARGNHEDSLAAINQVLALNSTNVILISNTLSNKSTILAELKRCEEALAVCEEALTLDRKNVAAWLNKGRVLTELKRNEEALAALDQVLALDHKNVTVWLNKGRVLTELKRNEEALAAFDQVLAIDSENIAAWQNKSRVLNRLNRSEEALAALDQVLALDHKNVTAWLNKGRVLTELKRNEEALAAFDQALALNSENTHNENLRPLTMISIEDDRPVHTGFSHSKTWQSKGIILGRLERNKEALAAFDQALTLDSKDSDTWQNKGVILGRLERYEEALAAFDQALALDSKDSITWLNKGKLLAHLERYKEAIAAANRVLALDSKNTDIQNFKAFLVKNWQLKQTLTDLDRAINLDPQNAAAWNNKGVYLFQLGNNEESLMAFDRAINLDPENSNARKNKQYILLRSGQHTEAIAFGNRLQDYQEPLTLQQPLNNGPLLDFIISKIDNKQSKQSSQKHKVGRDHRGKKAKWPKQNTRNTRAK